MRDCIANSSCSNELEPNSKQCQIITYPSHKLTKDMMSSHALEVVEKLEAGGFQAFIVGGSIRDLLLNRVPKDFDVATNANPKQIKSLFERDSMEIFPLINCILFSTSSRVIRPFDAVFS